MLRCKNTILILLILLAGCSVEKKIAWTHKIIEKHPEALNKYRAIDTIFKDSIYVSYRDTTIEIFLPGDTIEQFIQVPCSHQLKSDTAYAKSGFSEAFAWLSGGQLHLRVKTPSVALKYVLDSAILERNHYQELYIQELLKPPPEKITPKWIWFIVGIATVEFILLLLALLLRR